MTSDVEICNLALARLGDARITSMTDGSAQATYCSLLYSHTLEELQTDYAWAFCRKLAALSSTTAPAFGYSAAYTLPTDFLRLLRVNGIDKQENFGQWEILGTTLHTSLPAPIQADYLANVTTVTQFPALFVELFSLKLAANLAMPLTGSKELFGQMVEAFAASLQRPAVQELILSNARARATNTITTQADIVRLAILKTGTADGYKPEGQPALLGNSFYDQARNELLAEFNWSFARRAVSVNADGTNPLAGYARRYVLPSGALNIRRVNEVDSSENFGVWESYGQFIHTDATISIIVEYTDTVSTISQFPPVFVDLLVNKLASRLAMTNGDSGRMEILAKEAEIIYAKPAFAKAIEASAGARNSNAVATKDDICKQAVMRLGSTGALSQSGAQPAVFAHSFYDHTLEELLAELPWAFAKKQVSITANATAPTQGYSRRYALPSDFVQLLRVNQIDTTENFGQWEIVGGFLHTDLGSPAIPGSPVILDYTANITDVALFPAPFVEALIARITAKIALPLTGKADIANAMAAVAAESLNRPTIQVLVEKSAKPRAGSPANTVAEICRQAILKVGSADIFKPFGEPMVIAQSLYEQTRNEVLADFDWQFARVQSSLAADATPPDFGYSARYALPANTLKVLRVNGVDEDENFGNWEIVGGFLHTNFATPIRIETTAIVTDATKFPPVFTNMLTVTLAFKLSQLLEIQVAKA